MSADQRLEKALEDLNSAYLAVRIAAIQTITDARYLPALPRLMNIVRDQVRDERTRAMAARALGKLGDPAAVPALVDALREVPPGTGEEPSTEAVPGTISLKGVLLSANIPAALRALGTRDALDALDRWKRGELAEADAVAAREQKLNELLQKVREAQGQENRLRALMEAVGQIISVERSFVALKNPQGDTFDRIREVRGIDPDKIAQSNVTLVVIDQAADSGKPILTTNAQADPGFQQQHSIVTVSLRSVMAVPLKAGDAVIGVVYGDNRLRTGLIKADDFKLLITFAEQVGPLLTSEAESGTVTPVIMGEAKTAPPSEEPAMDWFGGEDYDFSETVTLNPGEATEVMPTMPPDVPLPPVIQRARETTPPPTAAPQTTAPPTVPIPASRPTPSPPPGGQTSMAVPPPPAPSPTSPLVQVAAYSPKTVILNDWQPLFAYVFRENVANVVVADAFEQLGRRQAGYSGITTSGQVTVAEGAQITATPRLPGFQINPLSVTIGFYDTWARFDFRLRAKDVNLNQFTTGTITFTINGVILADVPLSVFVGQAGGDDAINSAVSRIYQSIFCSYSHNDTHIVERVERAYKALGLDYLRDVTTLKSGDHWSNEILELIDRADIFQLFWSDSAAKSPYVRQEWMHALRYETQRPNFIRPVWWRAPMPTVPRQLSHIHFAYQPDLERV